MNLVAMPGNAANWSHVLDDFPVLGFDIEDHFVDVAVVSFTDLVLLDSDTTIGGQAKIEHVRRYHLTAHPVGMASEFVIIQRSSWNHGVERSNG